MEECEKQYYTRKHCYDGIWQGKDLMKAMLKNEEYRVQPCLQVINREFYLKHNLSFYDGIIHEDNLFNFQCILSAEKVGYISKQFFYRRYREGSTMTRTVTFAHTYGYFRCYLEMYQFFRNIALSEDCQEAALEILSRVLWGARNNYKKLDIEERNTIYGLPLHERTLFRLYVSNVCELKENWERVKRDKENLKPSPTE